jgi:hypothetical protein
MSDGYVRGFWKVHTTPEGINSASSGGRSPGQHPTPPLDLDVHPAQVAEEKIQYNTSSWTQVTKVNAEADKEGREDGQDGWIYLNLFVSMAQLHTISLTPGFIRKSIRTLSAKFELSEDGNKVRWKEGNEATQFSVPNSDMSDRNPAIDDGDIGTHHPNQRSNGIAASNAQISHMPPEDYSTHHPSSQSSVRVQSFSINPQRSATSTLCRSQSASSFDCEPILLAGKSLSRPNLTCLNGFSASHWCIDDCPTADLNETADGTANHADAASIVFYNVCSDFSGDRAPTNMRRPN